MNNQKLFLILVIALVLIAAYTLANRSYYSEKHPVLDEVRRRFAAINPKYGKIPLRSGPESYTQSKSAITLCIVNPDNNQFYDINSIMYVALHELAHVITKADGEDSHKEEFTENFAFLLKDAHNKGVYDARKPIPSVYCGVGPGTH